MNSSNSTESICPHTDELGIKSTSYLHDEIPNTTYLSAQLYLLAFATGMQDATTFPDYRCFASNQTGNTVLLAVGALRLGNGIFRLSSIAVSLALFIAGVALSGQLGNWLGVRKRWWLLTSSLLQTLLVFAAAALQYRYGVRADGPLALLVIALLAFAGGAQVAMVRSLKITEITTAMATAAFVDVFVDPRVLGRRNGARDRRLLFLLFLVAGSFAGAGAYRTMGSAFALLASAVGKLVVTLMFLFNRVRKV